MASAPAVPAPARAALRIPASGAVVAWAFRRDVGQALLSAFKLIEEAGKTWRGINGPEQIKLLLEGSAFRDGELVQGDQPGQQKLAA